MPGANNRMGGRIGRLLLAALMGTTALAGSGVTSLALAQSTVDAVVTFDIPAQSLGSAIIAFSRAAGINVFADGGIDANVTAGAVSGSLTISQGLSQLLAGTGYTYQANGSGVTLVAPGAAAAAPAADGSIVLDEVNVNAWVESAGAVWDGSAESVYSTPASVTVVTDEQINRVRGTTAGDLFRGMPGVTAVSNYNGTALDVNIRGLQGMNRVKVLVDGTQQDTTIYRGYAGPDNRNYVDPDLISSVAVEKGPSGGVGGAGAIGGVVSMSTVTAADILDEGDNFGVRVRGSIGGNSIAPRVGAPLETGPGSLFSLDSLNGSVVVAGRTENFELVAGISKRSRGNYFAGEHGDTSYDWTYWNGYQDVTSEQLYSRIAPGQEVPNSSEDTTSALVKATTRWGDGQSLEVGLLQYGSEYGVVFPSNLGFYAPAQYPLGNAKSTRYYAKYKWNPAEEELINFKASAWGADLLSRDPYNNMTQGWRFINETQDWGLNAANQSKLDTAFGLLTLDYGAEYTHSAYVRSYESPVGNPNIDVEGTREIGGAYTQAKLDFTDWLSVSGGLRYDSFVTDGVSRGWNETYSQQIFIPNTLEGSALSPNVGVTVTPLDGLQLFANYKHGWRPPSMTETFGSGIAAELQPNPDLKPETSRGWEVGANYKAGDVFASGDTVRAKLVYFDNSYEDYIARGYVGAGWGLPKFKNIDTARLAGIEANLSYDNGGSFTDLTANYLTKVEYCYTRPTGWGIDGCSEYPFPGDWAGGYVQPAYTASLTVGARFFDEALTVGARATHYGPRYTPLPAWNGFDKPVNWQEETIIDLFSSYKLSEDAEIKLSVDNLFDRYYVSPQAVATMPSPGRTVNLSFSAKF